MSQLAVNGRCACVVQESSRKRGKAILYERESENNISEKILFDASVPYLKGFEPVEEFSL